MDNVNVYKIADKEILIEKVADDNREIIRKLAKTSFM